MSALPPGITGYLLMALIIIIAHESWRWLGLWLARGLTAESQIFRWVQHVATALVAGLVMRLVLFPIGGLAEVPLLVRVGALAVAAGAFMLSGRNLLVGVGVSTACLLATSALPEQARVDLQTWSAVITKALE